MVMVCTNQRKNRNEIYTEKQGTTNRTVSETYYQTVGGWSAISKYAAGDVGCDARAGAESVMTGIAGFRLLGRAREMPREPCQVGIAYNFRGKMAGQCIYDDDCQWGGAR